MDTEAYNINGHNYFKLRDLAAMLTGTDSQFSISYSEATRSISIYTGLKYYIGEGDLTKSPDVSSTCVPNTMPVYIDGYEVQTTSFNLAGRTFYQLGEMSQLLGFGVRYDEATRTVIVTSGKQN